jgi:SAM domain (Sterile alpha motif)
MDVGGWLRRLGLEQYEAAFRENEIDDAVLPSLTAEDLKDLGVGFVGHRRMLLDAIAALRAQASAPTPLSDAPPRCIIKPVAFSGPNLGKPHDLVIVLGGALVLLENQLLQSYKLAVLAYYREGQLVPCSL